MRSEGWFLNKNNILTVRGRKYIQTVPLWRWYILGEKIEKFRVLFININLQIFLIFKAWPQRKRIMLKTEKSTTNRQKLHPSSKTLRTNLNNHIMMNWGKHKRSGQKRNPNSRRWWSITGRRKKFLIPITPTTATTSISLVSSFPAFSISPTTPSRLLSLPNIWKKIIPKSSKEISMEQTPTLPTAIVYASLSIQASSTPPPSLANAMKEFSSHARS